jgi:aminoglycoside phosphotransferase (APT) family kinase protein
MIGTEESMMPHTLLSALLNKHGLAPPRTVPRPWTGATSRVYPCGNVVVKIPFEAPPAIDAVRTDARVAPVAHALGVTTPDVIVFDDALDILPVPFSIVRLIRGAEPLDRHRGDDAIWRAVGREIALVHQIRDVDAVPVPLRVFRQSPGVDPRPWVDDLRERGVLNEGDARWLRDLLDALAPRAMAEVPPTLCHGDVNASNVMVDVREGRFRALIDWAGAGWLDPVWDFAALPMDVIPVLLEGHREIAPLPIDDTAEARICWCQIQTRLYTARATPRDAAGGEIVGRLLDQVRRFVEKARLR